MFSKWLSSSSSSSPKAKGSSSEQDEEDLHRQRVAQILRYIATMQSQTQVQFSFCLPREHWRSPFFQNLEESRMIMSWLDFTRLAELAETSSRTGVSSSAPFPFSFYKATGGGNARQSIWKRSMTYSSSETQPAACWLRLTRFTSSEVPAPPKLTPPVLQFLQIRLSQDLSPLQDLSNDDALVRLEPRLSWKILLQLSQQATSSSSASPKLQRWLRRYILYRQTLEWQRQLEPIYNHLFEFLSTNQEDDLMWGLGQAQWVQTDGQVLDGPLLQVRVEVELARDGALLVRPKEHAGVSLNRQVLTALSCSNVDPDAVIDNSKNNSASSTLIRNWMQKVSSLSPGDLSPGQPSTYIPILKQMAVDFSSRGSFVSSGRAGGVLPPAGPLRITDAWCVFASSRPNAVWARDAWAFGERLNHPQHHFLPPALRSLTLGPSALERSFGGESDSNRKTVDSSSSFLRPLMQVMMGSSSVTSVTTTKNNQVTSRPPFPLPTSEAQNRIAQLLLVQNYPAVVCEGPPGTGKTHTIANIVCAYLCQGKRVLVTSKGAPALSVLRERLPESVQELCVDVSKSESSGMRQLQQTVERLANKVAYVNAERELHKAQALQEQIEELEAELRSIDERLGSNADDKRELAQTQEGQILFESSLELIERAPWLMKTIAKNWDARKVERLFLNTKALVIAPEDPILLVDGLDDSSPPSDPLISLAAARAGSPLSYLKNALHKEILAKIPLIGTRMAQQCMNVEAELNRIRVQGLQPDLNANKSDWYLVVERLKREKAIHVFCQETLEPIFLREGWPREEWIGPIGNKNQIKASILPILEMATQVTRIAEDLNLTESLGAAMEMERLDKRRSGISTSIQTVAEELVAARVVAELGKNFSADAQSALVKFAQVSGKAKFGKSAQGTKMTQRQRRKRQEYLDAFEKCVRYIPSWILTSSQISDYLPSECLFDLVVIDEASQSDVTVLPGMLRGRQWLIVGDGKQVSPTESFVAEEQIEMLKAAIPESPFEASMLPGHSFFDLCAQAFPMGRVILREHFRCAPEIISYSNQEFYNGNLIPLRLPTSQERLKPSLVDIRIHGQKVGKINERECDEIVNQIGQYIDQCTLAKKRSIGVISLVGEEQSRLIRGRLLDRVGPHKYKLHTILVGEPPSFQGAERDIVFLSMVCSPGSVVTQSQLMHAQRVNVALSRARDRMVLIRSLDTHHIPNEQDIKFSVLDFFERARHLETNVLDESEDQPGEEIQRTNHSTMGSFRTRAETLLVRLLDKEGFSTLGMGVVWDNAICVENASGLVENAGRRAAICIEATGESKDDWQSLLQQQKSIERVGWKCMRVDAVSFLVDYVQVLASIRLFLTSANVLPRPLPLVPNMAEDPHIQDPMGALPDVLGAEHPIAIPVVGHENQQGEIVVVSSDDDEDEGEDDVAHVESPPKIQRQAVLKKEKVDEEENMDRLGNGEKADDYGNVADLGFLRASGGSWYDDEEEEDDHNVEDNDGEHVEVPFAAFSNPVAAAIPVRTARRNNKRAQRQEQQAIALDDDADEVYQEDDDRKPAAKRIASQQAVMDVDQKELPSVARLPRKRRSNDHKSVSRRREDLQEKQLSVSNSTKQRFGNDDLSSSGGDNPSAAASLSSTSSKNNRKRRRTLDKYSRDPRWSQARRSAEDDISHEAYMEGVQPEPKTMDWKAADANDQEDWEREQEENPSDHDDDDESYLMK